MPTAYLATVRLFSRLNLICAVIGAGLLCFVAAIIFLEVSSRALLGTSQLWVIEVSEYALLFITFLGAPYLLEKNMHVVLDLVYDSLPSDWRRAVTVLNAAIGFALCAILAVVGFGVVLDQYDVGVRQSTVMAPRSWWITASLPLGMTLMAVQFLDQGLRALVLRER
jgi:TRAP-type C4-dicarboxylate transport system permease small subunit